MLLPTTTALLTHLTDALRASDALGALDPPLTELAKDVVEVASDVFDAARTGGPKKVERLARDVKRATDELRSAAG